MKRRVSVLIIVSMAMNIFLNSTVYAASPVNPVPPAYIFTFDSGLMGAIYDGYYVAPGASVDGTVKHSTLVGSGAIQVDCKFTCNENNTAWAYQELRVRIPSIQNKVDMSKVDKVKFDIILPESVPDGLFRPYVMTFAPVPPYIESYGELKTEIRPANFQQDPEVIPGYGRLRRYTVSINLSDCNNARELVLCFVTYNWNYEGPIFYDNVKLIDTPAISTSSLNSGKAGIAYSSGEMNAVGGATSYKWSASGLPEGLSIDADTGEISGTPLHYGTSNVHLTLTDNIGTTADRILSLAIAPADLKINTDHLHGGVVGTAYKETLEATGDVPITWSTALGDLPSWLNLDAATGEISGIPTTDSVYSLTVKAENQFSSDTKTLSIEISKLPVTHTIDFDSNGGNIIGPITNITTGQVITLPIPVRSNYRFEGWFDGASQYTNNTPITKSTTLTAKWTLISASGSGGGNSTAPAATKTPTIEELITKLTKAQKQEIETYFEERMPYTLTNTSFITEALKQLTGDTFTEEQLKQIAASKELLIKLGIKEELLPKLITITPNPNAVFTDVPSRHWANESIRQAAALGLVTGMSDGSFVPSEPLQMADTFTFLDRVLLINHVSHIRQNRSLVERYITDKNHWAFPHMASIGSKLSESTLKKMSELKNEPISRELLAQILYEITNGELRPIREGEVFNDTSDSPCKEAINYCIKTGLLNGTGNNQMAPKKVLTRAEMMTVLIRLNNALRK